MSGGPKTKPTMGALAALAGPALAVANNVASVVNTETHEKDEEKKDNMFKRMSALFEWKSTDKASPPGVVEALTAALSNLTVHADNGEMNKRHQRQLSSFSTKRESTEGGKNDDDDIDQLSSILGDLNLIQVPGPLKGRQPTTPIRPPTDEAKKKKKKQTRGSEDSRIASHHPSETPPDDDDIAQFQRRLHSLPDYLQTLILSHGGNTHRDMLHVMTRTERHLREGSPLLRIVYKGPEDYTQKRDGTPPKARQKPGIKSVFCLLCAVEHDYKNIGHAAAHLTERHWGLKPWRCFTCDERFPHSDTRMTEHTDACFAAAASGWGQTLGFTNAWDTNHNGNSGSGVFYGTNGVPSSQTPPDSADDPYYSGNAMFAPSYQQHSYVPQAGLTFNHTPPDHSKPSGVHQPPSSSPNFFALPSQDAYIQPTSHLDTHGQLPPLSLDPRYTQTDDHPFAASPSSYGTPSPVRSSPTETRPHQRYPSTYLPFNFPSTSRRRHAPPANTRQLVTTGPTHNHDVASRLGSSSLTLAPGLPSTRAPVSSSTPEWHQQMTPAALQQVRVQRINVNGRPYLWNGTYQQVQQVHQVQQVQQVHQIHRSAVYDPHYAPQDNPQVDPTPSHTMGYEPLVPLFPSHFWPGEPIGQCNC